MSSRWLVWILALGALASCAPEAPSPHTSSQSASVPAAKPRRGRVTMIGLNPLFALQQDNRVLLYDARASVIHAFSHLPGAISWPRLSFREQLDAHEAEIRAAVAAGKTVVVYCTDARCPDARAVANQLAARGHTISVLEGGYHAWKDAGLPLE